MGINFGFSVITIQSYEEEHKDMSYADTRPETSPNVMNGSWWENGYIHFWDRIGSLELGKSSELRTILNPDDDCCGSREMTGTQFYNWIKSVVEKTPYHYFTWKAALALGKELHEQDQVSVYWG